MSKHLLLGGQCLAPTGGSQSLVPAGGEQCLALHWGLALWGTEAALLVTGQVTLALLASNYLKEGRISMDVLDMRSRMITFLR